MQMRIVQPQAPSSLKYLHDSLGPQPNIQHNKTRQTTETPEGGLAI